MLFKQLDTVVLQFLLLPYILGFGFRLQLLLIIYTIYSLIFYKCVMYVCINSKLIYMCLLSPFCL